LNAQVWALDRIPEKKKTHLMINIYRDDSDPSVCHKTFASFVVELLIKEHYQLKTQEETFSIFQTPVNEHELLKVTLGL
jgi:hypothetical protein